MVYGKYLIIILRGKGVHRGEGGSMHARCSGPDFDPQLGQVSWVRFSSPVKKLSPQGPRISFGRHNDPFIFTLL